MRPSRLTRRSVAIALLVAAMPVGAAVADTLSADANTVDAVIQDTKQGARNSTGNEAAFWLTDTGNKDSADPVNACNAAGGHLADLVLVSNKDWLTFSGVKASTATEPSRAASFAVSTDKKTLTIRLNGCDDTNTAVREGAKALYDISGAVAAAGDTARVSYSISGGKEGSGYTYADTDRYFEVTVPSSVAPDTTAPSITVTPATAPGGQDNFFNAADVAAARNSVAVSATDVSGVASIECTDNGNAVGPFATTLSEDGKTRSGSFATSTDDGTHAISCRATDKVTPTANTTAAADAVTGTLKIDGTAPAVVRNTEADGCSFAGLDGWCRGTQTAGFKATDAGSGLADTTQSEFTKQSAQNGVAVDIPSGVVKDKAGNAASAKGTFRIDSVAPVIVRSSLADACSQDGLEGWCRGEQTAGFKASDATSGVAPADAAFTKKTTTNGAAVNIASGAVSDAAGNSAASIDAGPFKIDSVNPDITGSRSPAANAAGWNNGDVTVSFECSDTGGSGIAQGSCPGSTTKTEQGKDQFVDGQVKDVAGNTGSAKVSDINIDTTAPSTPTATTSPAAPVADSGGWFKDAVTVSYGGSEDALSGVARYVPVSQKFTTSGTHGYSGKAEDHADNASQAVTGSVKVDATAPSLGVQGCPTGDVLLGSAQQLTVTASDAHSELKDDPSGTVALDTGSIGQKTAPAIIATDKVGHTTTASTCSYRVVYDWRGFFRPVENKDANAQYILNRVKAGSAVPMKFSVDGDPVADSNTKGGETVLEASTSTAPNPKVTSVTCPGSASVDAVEETVAATTSSLKYDATADQWVYVWKTTSTWAGSCRRFDLKLADGTTQTALFQFTK